MAYASQSDIQLAAGGFERFRDLVDFDGDGIIDPDVVARAQAAASSFIDPYLANRFGTPVASPWPELVTLAAEEAVYQIRGWKGMRGQMPNEAEDRKLREATLELYQKGIKRPPDPQPVASSAPQSAWVESDIDTAPVSREGLKGVW